MIEVSWVLANKLGRIRNGLEMGSKWVYQVIRDSILRSLQIELIANLAPICDY